MQKRFHLFFTSKNQSDQTTRWQIENIDRGEAEFTLALSEQRQYSEKNKIESFDDKMPPS
jgi:hypothetical protein